MIARINLPDRVRYCGAPANIEALVCKLAAEHSVGFTANRNRTKVTILSTCDAGIQIADDFARELSRVD